MLHERKNARQFNEFLRQLLDSKRGRRVVLVLDNASFHVTRATLDLLTEHEEHLHVLWLPKHSPELNVIEGLWGYLKNRALNNYFFKTIERLEDAVISTFAALNADPQTTLSLAYKTCRDLPEAA